jgi:hypothetical protein
MDGRFNVRVAIGTRLTKHPFTKKNWIRTWTSGVIPFWVGSIFLRQIQLFKKSKNLELTFYASN